METGLLGSEDVTGHVDETSGHEEGHQKDSQQLREEKEQDNLKDDNPLAFLRDHVQFRVLKQVIRESPDMLETLLKQIQYSNPQLYQVVQQNEQDFRDLIHEPEDDNNEDSGEDVLGDESEATLKEDSSLEKSESAGGDKKEKPLVIKVTAAERDSIERLEAMGYPHHMAVQAYFGCNKNEEIAAELLLQQDPLS